MRDWTDDGKPATLCPDHGRCDERLQQLFGCPYGGYAGTGTGNVATCPGWYRRQPLWQCISRAMRLRDFWISTSPDEMSYPLQELFFWASIFEPPIIFKE